MQHWKSLVFGPALLFLCSCGMSPEEMENAVHNYAAHGNMIELEELLQKKPALASHVNPDRNARKRQPLHEAANAAIVKLLLAQGAEVDAKDDFDWTPLHTAGNADVAEALIANGADIAARGQRGVTPLHTTESAEVAELLIRKGADVNDATPNGKHPPLRQHISNGHPYVIKVLLENNAKTDFPLQNGKTCLHLAADRTNPATVSLLLQIGMDPNQKDKLGATPLHYAVFKGCAPIVNLLLENGADPNTKLAEHTVVTTFTGARRPKEKAIGGYTPLQLAESEDVKVLLRDYAAKHKQPEPVAPPKDKKPARVDNWVGKPLADARRALGRPKMRMQKRNSVILTYANREIISDDGITVSIDRKRTP